MPVTQIAAPFVIGTASWLRGQTSPGGQAGTPQTITPSQNIPQGAVIYVGIDVIKLPAIPYSITDSAGNTYAAASSNSYLFASDPGIAVWAAFSAAPVTTAGSITITPKTLVTTQAGTFQEVNAVAVCVPSGAVACDQAGNGFSQGSFLNIPLGNLAYAGELAIGYWAAAATAGQPQPPSNWTVLSQFQGIDNTHRVTVASMLLPSAHSLNVRATTVAGGNGWGGVLITLQPVIVPTASLHCGGTVTPWHVSSVAATALLGCGGSILGPAETAPVPPPALPVFPPGYGPVPADFRNWVQQAFGYVSHGTVFRAEQHTAQNIPGTTFTPLIFDDILEDPWGGWSASSTSRQAASSWLVPWTGLYRVTFRYLTAGSTLYFNNPAIGVNGSGPALELGAMTSGGGEATFVLPLLQGDYVEMLAWCGGAVSTDVSAPGRYASVEITAIQTDLPS